MQQNLNSNTIIPVTWKIALIVLWRHNLTANRLTGKLVLCTALISWFFAQLVNVSTHDWWLWIRDHRWLLVIITLLIHLTIVNLYAVKKILSHPIGQIQITLIKKSPA